MILKQLPKRLVFGICTLLLCSFSFNIKAQAPVPETLEIKLVAEATGDFVILRWAPLDFATWDWGVNHGYVLERITMKGPNGTFSNIERTASHVVIGDPILPIPESEWKTLANTDDLAGVAAGAIYGEGFVIDTLSTTDLMSAYNVNKEQENRFGFSLFAADQAFYIAEAMGLGYLDQTVEAGHEYVYRVIPKDAPSTAEVINGVVIISPDDVEPLPQPADLSATAGDGTVSLSWSKANMDDKYTSFIVERSADDGSTFERANPNPLIFTTPESVESENLIFVDSLETNGELYIYRVKGTTPFGIEGPASDTIHVIGKPAPIPARPSIQTITEDVVGTMNVTWDFPNLFEGLIDGFDVYRADRRDGVYTKINSGILGATSRNFTDLNPNSSNYYLIKALDSNGYELESFASLGQINDEEPPAPPTGLSGEASTNGVVTLRWSPNSEDDLMGYRVYVSNHDAGEFLQITTTWVKDTVFHHPINLNNLGEQIYFKVKAIDNRENYSDASASVAVERPDIIPPSPPNITSFEAKMQGIDLAWLGSSSKDVVKHQLQRKAMHEASWEVIYDSSNDDFTNNYLDSDASYKYLYQYRLVAFDDADLSSSSKIMTIQPLDNGLRPQIQDVDSDIEIITVDIDDDTGTPTLTTSTGVNVDVVNVSGPIQVSSTPTTGQQPATTTFGVVKLRWSYFDEAVPCGLHSFQIYRATNDEQMRAFKTIFPDSGAFSSSGNMITYGMMDAEVSSGNTYTYQIMAKYIDGAYSPMSEQTLVTY